MAVNNPVSGVNTDNSQQPETLNNNKSTTIYTVDTNDIDISIPNYGYSDFRNDLSNWRKQLSSLFGDPGWFYFKIFFHFDTHFGLLGDTLGASDTKTTVIQTNKNNALHFLNIWKDFYPNCKLADRATALKKFAAILSFINRNAPWFWQGVSGLDKAGIINLNEPFKTKQTIEIDCLEDAVDMRLTTMMDLYKYACFDYVNFKEIIPENLRKFDMSIAIFSAPIMYLHTTVRTYSGSFGNKDMLGVDNERMSFKLFTFKNCEFTGDSLGNYIPNNISNTKPFQIGKNKLTITYDRCYQHTSSEFNEIVFGDTGFMKSNMNKNEKRMSALKSAVGSRIFTPSASQYKALIDETEENIKDALRSYNPKILFGN